MHCVEGEAETEGVQISGALENLGDGIFAVGASENLEIASPFSTNPNTRESDPEGTQPDLSVADVFNLRDVAAIDVRFAERAASEATHGRGDSFEYDCGFDDEVCTARTS